jgi:hypothetical protein
MVDNISVIISTPDEMSEFLKVLPDDVMKDLDGYINLNGVMQIISNYIMKVNDYFIDGKYPLSSLILDANAFRENDVKWLIKFFKNDSYPVFIRKQAYQFIITSIPQLKSMIESTAKSGGFFDVKAMRENLDRIKHQWKEVAQGIKQIEQLGIGYEVNENDI